MSEEDHTIGKLEALMVVLGDMIGATVAAGVSKVAVRRTLLAFAVQQFKSDPSDGIAALDHFRKALERGLVPSSAQVN